jgi:hypothetical protein
MKNTSELQSIASNISRLQDLIDDYKEEMKAAYEIAASSCVSLDEWREACRQRGLAKEGGDAKKRAEAERKAFGRAWPAIDAAGYIGAHGDEVWLLGQQASKAKHREAAPWLK